MTDLHHGTTPVPSPIYPMRLKLQAAVDIALPQTPSQFAERLIQKKWGQDLDPHRVCLVTLDYDYRGHSAINGVHQGRVANSQSLLQALLNNEQRVGDGRFAENAFGFYTPPDTSPTFRAVENVDEFADHGSGNHQTFEGIYRSVQPQTYGPLTQISIRPADFKQWVWQLDLPSLYQAYLARTWPSDTVIAADPPYALRTATKAAFLMTAWLQRHEQRLTEGGLMLAMQVAGLSPDQAWETLSIEQLQASTHSIPAILARRLKLYRYTATDIWCFTDRTLSRLLLYIPGNSSALHEFTDVGQLRQWVVAQGHGVETRQALAEHFSADDRQDGMFHAGVVTALDAMAVYPKQHWLTKDAGFFNNDGFWDPQQYISFDEQADMPDPFAQLVLTMKQAATASLKEIRSDAQVNRDELSAVVEPVVHWINQFGPLALFVPGGDGLLALAGLIDAGYGLNEAVNSGTYAERTAGVTRTVFGLLNALPLVGAGAELEVAAERTEAGAHIEHVVPGDAAYAPEPAAVTGQSRLELIRGIGPSVASFSDDVLKYIGKISTVDDDMLRLIQTGRAPSPLLADTISRFRIEQEIGETFSSPAQRAELFNSRYELLQHSTSEWVKLFQHEYPGLPKSAIEQTLDRYGVDIRVSPDAGEALEVFKRLDGKARQYQQHARLNRAYEGLYLRSVIHPETDVLVLHSLHNLPDWPVNLRFEVLDRSASGRILDHSGSINATDIRRLIKVENHYRHTLLDMDIYEAIFQVLTDEERMALKLRSAGDLRLNISNCALSRDELIAGLSRMDSGLAFDSQGLRGGGFPTTAQGDAFHHAMIKVRIKEIYPDFSDAQAQAALQGMGARASERMEWLSAQFQQLNIDLHTWIDQVPRDINDMDIAYLRAGDEAAQGLSETQINAYNVELLQSEMHYERVIRTELAVELVAIWQKRGGLSDVKLDMDFEDYHRLPVLNVKINDVVELSMGNSSVTEQDSLSGFLATFPNLHILNLKSVNLRQLNIDGVLESALPADISKLRRLVKLNLSDTRLAFTEKSASGLCELHALRSLDLSENPLGVPPLLLGMNNLQRINLRNTGISRCPIGIMDEPYLSYLDLRDNLITRVPQSVFNQATVRGRVQLWGNPITDADTLRRLVTHRQQTGFNLWLSEPGPDYGLPTGWLNESTADERAAAQLIWQQLKDKPSGPRFLRVIDGLSLMADFRVDYLALKARVWRLLGEAHATPALWEQLSEDVEAAAGDADNPLAIFEMLEQRLATLNPRA
ncbi:dermonecrotic toxin domain-containing protein [Rhodococcus sp. IEGM1300]